MRVDELLNFGVSRLKSCCERPLLESETLLCFAIEKTRVWLHINGNEVVESKKFFSFLDRREKNEPIEYITNIVSFYSRDFNINRGVLIPRPETEILVDLVNEYIDNRELLVVEVGVGSGIISIMLALLNPNIKIIGTDINKKAIELSKKNAKKFGVDSRIDFRYGSILDTVDEKIDLLVSNPPYIANDYKLPKNVKFEPKEALFGGDRGDEFLHKLIDITVKRDIKAFFCEFGYDQKNYIDEYVVKYQKYKISFYKDLANIDRGFVLEDKS